MTSYRNIFKNTRPFFLATAAGVVLCAPASFAQAQTSPGVPSSAYPLSTSGSEPLLMPQPGQTLRPVDVSSGPVHLTSAQTISQGDYRQSMPKTQPQDFNVESGKPRQTAFAERFGKIFKGKPTTPPVDPGMVYPKASEQPVAPSSPPPAPGASNSTIPSIPPTYGSNAPQPGLFQAPPTANAIGTNAIPPLPAGMDALAQQPPTPETTGTPNGVKLQNIPELKIIMTGQGPPPAPGVSPEVVQASNLPKLDFDAPLPSVPPQIAPGEPSEAPTAQARKSSDPFADLFPADQKKPAEAEAMAKQDVDPASPYTGKSLEVGTAGTNVLPPPPAEEQISVVKTPNSEIPALPEVKSASLAPITMPSAMPTAPAAPTLDIIVPSNLPKLSDPPVNQKPALTTISPPPASTPPAQDEQKSKLEQIAARKHLKGLKGFCPVVLRDERNLQDASFEFMVSYNRHNYTLSSSEAREKFLADPAKYAPAEGGCDVIHLALTGEYQEGSLEHAVWYKGRLYLFNGVETMETFVAAPSSHATIN